MTDTHEVYPNAPISLVAVEVRFPDAGGPAPTIPTPLQRAFRSQLGEGWVIEQLKTQRVALMMGPGGAGGAQTAEPVVVPRFTVRDRTVAVAITPGALTIEATRYEHYPSFRTVIEQALEAADKVLTPDGVARVGMRYIDEIRVPGVDSTNPITWEPWIDPGLLPPHIDEAAAAGLLPTAWEGAVQYSTGTDRKLILRYTPRDGYAVNPDGPLKRPSPPAPGPLFILDFDSYWEPPDIPEFDPGQLLETCDELRRPVRALFDLLIPDRLLTDVFRQQKGF